MKKVIFYVLLVLFAILLGVLVWYKDSVLMALSNGLNATGLVGQTSPTNQNQTSETQEGANTIDANVQDKSMDQALVVNSPYKNVKIHLLGTRGNAILVDFNGRWVLIDSGFYSDKELIIKEMKNLGVRRLDYFVVTNYHNANIGSAYSLIHSIPCNYIILPENITKTKDGKGLVNKLDKDKFIWSVGKHNIYYEVNKKDKTGFKLLNTYHGNNSLSVLIDNVLITGTSTAIKGDYLKSYPKVEYLIVNGVNKSYYINEELFKKVTPNKVIVLGDVNNIGNMKKNISKETEFIQLKGFCKKSILELGSLNYKCLK